MSYIDMKLLEDAGEEREALLNMVAQALEEATEKGVGQVVVVMKYRRKFQHNGQWDNPREIRPLRISAGTADANRVVDQALGRLREGFGRGFMGQVIVGVENPEHPGEPLAGVWDRELAYGDATDSPYGMAMAEGGGGFGGGPPPSGNGSWGGGGGSWSPEPPPRRPHPAEGSYTPTTPEPTPLSHAADYDPGGFGQYNAEDRELVRSVIGAQERRADISQAELRARDNNFFRMLDYNQRLNHQFMQLLGMVFGRWVPPAMPVGPPPQHPLVGLVTGLLGMFFPTPTQPSGPGAPTTAAPPPPRIEPPPAFRPSFYEPQGPPEDLHFGPGTPVYGASFRDQDGAFDPHEAAREAAQAPRWRPPSSEQEWDEAFQADPGGAKRAAAKIVPAPFNRLLGGKSVK